MSRLEPRERCSRLNKNGDPCGASAIRGGTVCVIHGGNSPLVKIGAERRLEEARQAMLEELEPALEQYRRLLTSDEVPAHVRIKALTDLFDRVGLGAVKKIENTNPVDEEIKRLAEELRAQG